MATPQERLANSLEVLKELQNDKGIAVIKSSQISRAHRERLVDNGFLKPVIKSWYISSRPDERDGDTTSWYTCFWSFAREYITDRFGNNWCLSPEQSLLIHAGSTIIPQQLLVRSPDAKNNIIQLLHGTSFIDAKLDIPDEENISSIDGINVVNLPLALVTATPGFYQKHSTDARTCLSIIKDASEIMTIILDKGMSTRAARLAGAFRNIGNDRIADQIINTMNSLGYNIKEEDPFAEQLPTILNPKETSPAANRIKLMWHNMRQTVIDNFPESKNTHRDLDAYLKSIDERYKEDAYHSLSIEGYNVTIDLIEKVKSGDWKPDTDPQAKQQKDAMAARGYFQCFNAVKESIKAIHEGKNSGLVVDQDHNDWYRELFAPSVAAGLVKPSDLAGYRSAQVYIRGSQHTPFTPNAVRDAMPTLFELLEQEENAAVRAILGHFIFVYIHPYMDGNGRIGRFLLNVMLFSGGYDWLVIPVEKRNQYMTSLEKASAIGDIEEFVKFLGRF
ncbi:Fic family protein [Saccharicrinis aurantiacus]|uniref:Fic family protein n=1 Tax=Saccharicrinis aurantiacus TaxID=1849719 RepID=UPI00248FC687|nr:Fic family protein [Saccharicrinis aurantiacus]